MKYKQFRRVVRWQGETFPNADALSKAYHLKEEVDELIKDLKSNSPKRWSEYADCFMLLFGSASADGMSYEDICEAIEKKLKINRRRKWGKPDENGVVKHIKE